MSEISTSPGPPPGASSGTDSAGAAYLAALNESQRRATETLDGPLLVLAGAGTGKTRVLTTRIVHLIATRRAFPSQILAVTFTNKAAREMRDRISAVIGPMAEQLWLGTFHAVGARILRRHAEAVGLRPNFTILDMDDQIRLLKQLLQAESIDDKRWPARQMIGVIQRWKDRGLVPEKVPAGDAGDLAGGRLVALYAQYQERLATLNAADFGDLLLHCLTLFTKHPDILADYHRRFRYLLVDEYQDTNVAQYLWLRLLAQGHRNLCCVGDDDQSIYGWRGAEVGNILRFEADFPGAAIVRLERNYRSTPEILAAASGLIAHNEGRLGKTLWTDAGAGEPIRLKALWDGEEEARWIGDEIEALQAEGHALSEIAILVRAGFQTREFEERFITLGLPYRVVGGPRFYERQEIRDAVAYLRVIVQPDDDLAFERIVNVPRRGIGDATLRVLRQAARAGETSILRSAERVVATDELRPAARTKVTDLLASFRRWRAMLDGMSHVEVVETVLDESGYTAMWQADRSPDAPGRLENLKELVAAIAEFENLAGFLEHISLVMEGQEASGSDQVSVMTLHGAKGLEFETVFLPGWEEGLFPHQRALDESGGAGLEEERRLAYVGITRAKRRAIITHAANRRVHNLWQSALPSRFIDELPDAPVDREALPSTHATRGFGGGWSRGGGTEETAGAVGTFDYASWERMRSKAMRAGPLIEARARVVEARPVVTHDVGTRVFHDKFGYGVVQAADGDRCSVDFETSGVKKVIASFLQKA